MTSTPLAVAVVGAGVIGGTVLGYLSAEAYLSYKYSSEKDSTEVSDSGDA